MKARTNVKPGGKLLNHNETIVAVDEVDGKVYISAGPAVWNDPDFEDEKKSMKVETDVKPCGRAVNHNETMVSDGTI